MGIMTLKELLGGANSDAQIMFEKAKKQEAFCKHPSHRNSSTEEKHSPRSFLLSMMGEILFYMTKTLFLKQETLGSISVP